MFCVGWEAHYETTWEGRAQVVNQYVIATAKGLVHYKIVHPKGGRTRVFMDLDASFKLKDNRGPGLEEMKRHVQFGRTQRECTKAGKPLHYMEWSDTADILPKRPVLEAALKSDERAMNAWNTICGTDNTPRFDDLLSTAEEIQEGQRQAHLHKKAVAMAEVDDNWGIF